MNIGAEQSPGDEVISRFSDFIAGAMGLHFPSARWPDLQRALAETAIDLGMDDPLACARHLMSHPLTDHQLATLADHLTVGETYFFREPRSFEILAGAILPELIRLRERNERRIRIWSAACCTGEEPYSIAIQLYQSIPNLNDWNVTILATDINPRFLRKAEAGIFGPWSFRNTPERIRESYFRPAGKGQFEILPHIKRLVRFANLNLVEDGYPSLTNDTNAMDVVFCRNVLMYFTPEQSAKVVEKLHRCQMPDGWLLVSATELSQVSLPQYKSVNFPGATLYRKGLRSSQAVPAPVIEVREEIQYTPIVPVALDAPVVETPEPASPKEPPKAPAIDALAKSLANEGKLTEALACCDRWIAREKLNATAHYLRAVVLQEQGAFEPAIQSLRAAVYLDPSFVLAHFALGNIAKHRGRDREADKHLGTSLRLSARYRDDEILPESDGITARRFAQIIRSLMYAEVTA